MAIATANHLVEHPAHRASGGMAPISGPSALHLPAAHLSAVHLSGPRETKVSTPHLRLPHRDAGGMTGMPTPGLAPTLSTENPMEAGYIQQLSGMSAEQLQELAVRLGGSPYGQIVQRVLAQKRMAPQQTQATQNAALSQQSLGMQAQQTLTPQPISVQQPVPSAIQQQARGGPSGMRPARSDRHVPILAAGGEFVVSPQHVAKLGGGDISKGHRLLDRWVVDARRKIIDKMESLRPPVKS